MVCFRYSTSAAAASSTSPGKTTDGARERDTSATATAGAGGAPERPGRLLHFRRGYHQHPPEPGLGAGRRRDVLRGRLRLQGLPPRVLTRVRRRRPPEEVRRQGRPASDPQQVHLHPLRPGHVPERPRVPATLRERAPSGPGTRTLSGTLARDGGRRQPDHRPGRQGRGPEPARQQRQHLLPSAGTQEAQDVPLSPCAQRRPVNPSHPRHDLSPTIVHVELPIYIYFVISNLYKIRNLLFCTLSYVA